MKSILKTSLIALIAAACLALNYMPGYSQSASDPQFKVKIDFNRWHDIPELKSDLQRLERAFPKFLKYSSVGQSYKGREMMLMTINNPDTGLEMDKSAIYIEANVHGNEIQGGEVCLYTVWYLMENYGKIDQVTKLVDERVFYIFPCVNPDGRQFFMEGSGSDSRTGHFPVDSDGDGQFDEDGPDDINGNGVIDTIRKYVPGKGNLRLSRDDPRILEEVPFGEFGDYIILGREGLDNDGDGMVNEDGPGGYDPNRNWASNWQPNYIQRGSLDYPFQLPAARAINDFLMSHPNIAGVQSYHNTGGMILRGPGAEWAGEYPREDLVAYDEIGEAGARILPFYRYFVIWDSLYTVHGGFIDWTNDGLGMMSYSNELWSGGDQYFTSPTLQRQRRDPDSPIRGQLGNYYFDDNVEMGAEYVEWAEFDHPQYGKVEMGGWKKTRGRLPPRFMNEELCHRNMAFTLYQAEQLPMMKAGETKIEKISGDMYKVWIDLTNEKVTPTITELAARNNVVRPDLLTVDGNVEIVSASWVRDKHNPGITSLIKQHDLKRIQLRNGMQGKTTKTIQFLVKGRGRITVKYDSKKGGKVETTVNLR